MPCSADPRVVGRPPGLRATPWSRSCLACLLRRTPPGWGTARCVHSAGHTGQSPAHRPRSSDTPAGRSSACVVRSSATRGFRARLGGALQGRPSGVGRRSSAARGPGPANQTLPSATEAEVRQTQPARASPHPTLVCFGQPPKRRQELRVEYLARMRGGSRSLLGMVLLTSLNPVHLDNRHHLRRLAAPA